MTAQTKPHNSSALYISNIISPGAVTDHFVISTGLEANNYIIKAIWLPGSQNELALVTADFVKIFDLSKDLGSPLHYFLVPSGKVSLCLGDIFL